MLQSNKIKEYLHLVCNQVRWKKAHSIIAEELENHMIDQRDAFILEGLGEDVAVEKAINEMGDPMVIGTELDRSYRPKMEWSMLILTFALVALGFFIREFISAKAGYGQTGGNSFMVVALGGAFLIAGYYLDFTYLSKYPKGIYLLFIVLVIGSLATTPKVRGAYASAKFLFLLFPMVFSGLIYRMRNRGLLGIVLCGIFFGIVALLALCIPSTSLVLMIAIICLTLLTIGILKDWFHIRKIYALCMIYIPSIIVVICGVTARRTGFEIALNPNLDPQGAGFLGVTIRSLIWGAKFLGQGEAIQGAEAILPMLSEGYLLTYLIHRVGWISFFIIMGVLFMFFARGMILCQRQKSFLGQLVSVSILLTFLFQVVMEIMNNLGIPLFSFSSLLFISYGNAVMVMNLFLMGLLLSVFKSGRVVKDKKGIPMENKFFEYKDGKLTIHLQTK